MTSISLRTGIAGAFRSRLFVTLFALALGGGVLAGCDSTANGDSTAMVNIDLAAVFDGTPVSTDASTVYTIGGRNITLSSARIYLSEITLLKSDGSEVTFVNENPVTVPAKDPSDNDVSHTVSDQIVLAKHDAGQGMFALGEAEAGSYTGIRYKVGIDGLNNRVDATQVPASHPLAKQTDANNHWSWNSGYIFLRMDGTVDTDGDGTTESDWETHIGTGNFLNEIQLNHAFDLNEGDEVDLHIIVDYAQFVADIDFSNAGELLCHTMDNLPVAQKVDARVANAFMFHGVHTH